MSLLPEHEKFVASVVEGCQSVTTVDELRELLTRELSKHQLIPYPDFAFMLRSACWIRSALTDIVDEEGDSLEIYLRNQAVNSLSQWNRQEEAFNKLLRSLQEFFKGACFTSAD